MRKKKLLQRIEKLEEGIEILMRDSLAMFKIQRDMSISLKNMPSFFEFDVFKYLGDTCPDVGFSRLLRIDEPREESIVIVHEFIHNLESNPFESVSNKFHAVKEELHKGEIYIRIARNDGASEVYQMSEDVLNMLDKNVAAKIREKLYPPQVKASATATIKLDANGVVSSVNISGNVSNKQSGGKK